MNTSKPRLVLRETPPQLWIGLALVTVAWPPNWLLPGLRTQILFFPLWLGYALTVDGLVLLRKGSSLLARSWRGFVGLFLVSAPAWWLFELINQRTQNWEYVGKEHFSDLAYFVLASISFSTVMPAVFGTAELVGTTIENNTDSGVQATTGSRILLDQVTIIRGNRFFGTHIG